MKDIFNRIVEAKKLKELNFGRKIETCAILNAKSGKCSSDCKFCAQSVYYGVEIKEYPLLPESTLLKKAREMFSFGVDRFSFVTSGISLSREEVKRIGRVIEKLSSEGFKVCASLGQISEDALKYLRDCGLSRYHHNLETSREFYRHISSKQRWEDRLKTVINAKQIGLSICCGGIFGIGESEEDVASLIQTLKELDVDSIPVNFLHPIRGTPLENAKFLTPLKCLDILTTLRFSMPDKQIRVCGGREYNLRSLQPLALLVADSLMVGNYLTTKGKGLREDAQMIRDLGLESSLSTL